MAINSQWLTGISFSRWWRELNLCVTDVTEEHPILLHFTSEETFNTESGSVNEACKKKRMCIVLDWIAH